MLEVGKLYSCSAYYLMLSPDKEAAAKFSRDTTQLAMYVSDADHHAKLSANYWSMRLGKPVSFCNPETPFLVLSIDGKCIEVLTGNKKAWIRFRKWLSIKEIRNA